ncbi:MAG: polysaccharide deacetylase family protein [Campylobacterales bacterium]|nr:polysaccharide deacetylase family protein [Campylobacterales bacterium]
MLKFLFAIIIFLSAVMINLFSTPKKHERSDLYFGKKFQYNDIDMTKSTYIRPDNNTKTNTKYIYLSFDDGPLNGSQYINSIAYKYRVPFNVMVVGQHVFMNKNQKNYFKDYIDNPFIEVNNHSYSHANNQYYSFYAKPKDVLSDFNKSMNLLAIENKIARLPGRNVWAINNKIHNNYSETNEAVKLLSQNGYKLIGWDIEWHYDRKTKAPSYSSQEFFSRLKEHFESNKQLFTPNNIVVLLHDPMFRKNSSELESFIKLVQAQEDYVIVPLSQYPVVNLPTRYAKNIIPQENQTRI